MSEPTAQQTLSPQFCFSTAALRDFLRISRGTIDDSITQNLNALVTPAAAGFDPRSTSQRNARPAFRQQIDARSCVNFKEQVLFPSWQARSDVLSYCAIVATSPDPDDPDAAVRAAELEKDRERVVDERLDPYSARFFPKEPRTTQLAMLIRQEQGVEAIIRTRTWGLVRERCSDPLEDWQAALAKWRRDQGSTTGTSP
ncbi:caffeine-induced death protein 2 [Coniella lustricola]|uniref:Caffeine-induced death protein 2 n=1 Tax=Coniella lustricola TaxID=2025994 RepID=A0A2T3A0D6_9PEZI|nr:caffeine-induced death protein 2 [Coniella lustricola]